MLSDELKAKIRRLYFGEHWTVGTIADQLGIHHTSVKRAIDVDLFASRGGARPSALDPFVPFMREMLEKHPNLTGTRLHEMIAVRGYGGSAVQVRRKIRELGLRPRRKEAFFSLSTLPGEQGQVDWGHFGKLRVGGTERPLNALVIVLSWSRAIHAMFSFDQKLASVLRGHVEAFEYFGGVPRTLLYDNMKTVVLERRGDAIRYQPRFLELSAHYLFAARPCRPARGNEKGRVERAIGYLRTSFFQARTFADLDDVREQFEEWRERVAHARPCPQSPELTVAEALERERPALLSLPQRPIDHDLSVAVVARKQPYVVLDTNRYSIPWALVGEPLTLVASDVRVRVLRGSEVVAEHARCWDRRQTIEEPNHFAGMLESKRKAKPLKGRDRVLAVIPAAETLYKTLLNRNEPTGSHTTKLLTLLDQWGAEALAEAVAEAIARGTPRADSVAFLLERRCKPGTPPQLRPRWNRPDIDELTVKTHDLEDYDELYD